MARYWNKERAFVGTLVVAAFCVFDFWLQQKRRAKGLRSTLLNTNHKIKHEMLGSPLVLDWGWMILMELVSNILLIDEGKKWLTVCFLVCQRRCSKGTNNQTQNMNNPPKCMNWPWGRHTIRKERNLPSNFDKKWQRRRKWDDWAKTCWVQSCRMTQSHPKTIIRVDITNPTANIIQNWVLIWMKNKIVLNKSTWMVMWRHANGIEVEVTVENANCAKKGSRTTSTKRKAAHKHRESHRRREREDRSSRSERSHHNTNIKRNKARGERKSSFRREDSLGGRRHE